MKNTLPSYEYATNMAAQYLMQAQTSTDQVRQDINLVATIRWAKKARQALIAPEG